MKEIHIWAMVVMICFAGVVFSFISGIVEETNKRKTDSEAISAGLVQKWDEKGMKVIWIKP